jgi:hypothetical protein
VRAAYDAVNRHDYKTAYSLGLATSGQSYASFARGYQGTASVTLTIVGVEGDTVTVALTAVQKDGSEQKYDGTYTVSGGQITGAQIKSTG